MSGGQILDKVPFFFSERQFYRNILPTLHIVIKLSFAKKERQFY